MTAWLGLVKAAVTLHLFFGAKKRDSLTVTDKMVYWVMPSAVKSKSQGSQVFQITWSTS